MAKILIVDDTVITHRLLDLMLSQDHHISFSAHNGLEAKALLSETRFDMVITDINMPYMDGLALLDWVREQGRFQELPVIVLTASGQEQIKESAVSRGATGFLNQPFSSWELKKMVADCLGAYQGMRTG